MTTEAVRTKSRYIELGTNLSAFMRELRLIPSSASGGKRSDATRLRKQMQRLFSARISVQMDMEGPHRRGEKWLNMEVTSEGEFWWDWCDPQGEDTPPEAGEWGSWIQLGGKFFQTITTSPVPLDMRALRALRRSPLALDLYAWAAYKAWVVNQKQTPQFVSWYGLMEQLGADYDPKRIDHFKDKVKATLTQGVRGIPRRPAPEMEPERLDLLAGNAASGSSPPTEIHHHIAGPPGRARKNRPGFYTLKHHHWHTLKHPHVHIPARSPYAGSPIKNHL